MGRKTGIFPHRFRGGAGLASVELAIPGIDAKQGG